MNSAIPVSMWPISGPVRGAKYVDLAAAASVLKGRRIASGITLKVAPASRLDQDRAAEDGVMKILEDAGAQFLPNSCGICAGYGEDRLAEDDVCLSSTARQFQGADGRAGIARLSGISLHRGSVRGCRPDA